MKKVWRQPLPKADCEPLKLDGRKGSQAISGDSAYEASSNTEISQDGLK
jgi:hypothetical protein